MSIYINTNVTDTEQREGSTPVINLLISFLPEDWQLLLDCYNRF